ncbi:helix-turn-helix domain-containing protein [Escherichia coli]
MKMISTIQKKGDCHGRTHSRERGRKPAVATAPATGQVQSLTRGLKLLEWIAESNGSVALTELAQQAGLPIPRPTACNHDATAGFRASGWRTGTLGNRRTCLYGRQQLSPEP